METKGEITMQYDTCRRVQDAIAYLRTGAPDGLDCGRYELPDGAFVTVSRYCTHMDGVFEAHRRYIDIQYLIEGSERIETADVEKLCVTQEYDGERDILFGMAEGVSYTLGPGQYIVLLPEEAHRPGLAVGEPAEVKKAVVKVPI